MNQSTLKQGWNNHSRMPFWNNAYQCAHCGNEWYETWESKIAMHCENCGVQDIEPCQSELVNERG